MKTYMQWMKSWSSSIQYVYVLYLALYLFESLNADDYACHEFRSCSHNNLSDTSSNNIECWDYQSCFNSTSIISVNSGTIMCYGWYSCYSTSKITQIATINNQQSIKTNCEGLYACANVGSIIVRNTQLLCDDDRSCTNSVISSTNERVYCTGYLSCRGSELTSNGTMIHMQGFLSGENSIVTVIVSKTTEIILYGGQSGKNMSISCSKSSCVNCQFDCDLAEKSDCCPNGLCFLVCS